MNTEAASVIMKTMYAAPNWRCNLLSAVGALARRLTKRGALESRKPRQPVEYIHSSHNLQLTGFVGGSPGDLELAQHSDAGYAGGRSGAHITSGAYLVLVGSHTWYPLL